MDLALAVWFSPMFPVGAFAYSHALEWAHEAGDVSNAESLQDWLQVLTERGALTNDAIVLVETHHAARRGDTSALSEINELALALATSRERHLETTTQGNAFRLAIAKSWPGGAVAPIDAPDIAYPVAVGIAAVNQALSLAATLDMFCLGFVANLVSAAIRLGVIGQTNGQTIIANLLPGICATARRCEGRTLDDLGSSAFRSDLASLKHETQYSRLFRS